MRNNATNKINYYKIEGEMIFSKHGILHGWLKKQIKVKNRPYNQLTRIVKKR